LPLLKKLEDQIEKSQAKSLKADDSEELDVNLANSFKPSAIGLSFLIDLSKEKEGITVELVSVSKINRAEKSEMAPAFYEKKEVAISSKEDFILQLKKEVSNRFKFYQSRFGL
jgi:hypothetical protein